MKALTIKQPFASLIMLGEKKYETRSWTPFGLNGGDWLAIHAGMDRKEYGYTQYMPNFIDAFAKHELSWRTLPFGAILGVAQYIGSAAGYLLINTISHQEFAFGGYGSEQYGWRFGTVLALPEPLTIKGKQGIWRVEDTTIATALQTLIRRHNTQAQLAAVQRPAPSPMP